MKQKFKKLSHVQVCEKMPDDMSHFECGFKAIVKATHAQLYSSDSFDSYSLYQIKNGRIINCISWYHAEQLTLLPTLKVSKTKKMIREYENYLNGR